MPHELKVRDRDMRARRRSKMAVLTPSMVKAAAVPGGQSGGERVGPYAPHVLLEFSFPGPRQRDSGEKERK